AHSVVDVGMSFDVPRFVPAQQTFTYRVIADNRNNDNGSGIVITIVLPSSVKFSRVAAGSALRCTESRLTITCSAELLPSGPNAIDVIVTAPANSGAIHASANSTSLGSLDLNPANDNASSDVIVYDPSACRAVAPLLLGPADESAQPAVVSVSWSPVD